MHKKHSEPIIKYKLLPMMEVGQTVYIAGEAGILRANSILFKLVYSCKYPLYILLSKVTSLMLCSPEMEQHTLHRSTHVSYT